ncbi:hypothetical protein NQ905_02505 [Clostridioides difficile]|nr:hypothetical protein [Clostridioides difficile]HBF4081765.1 hypothetical protein [Clostridioides difficile]HBG4973465.1 hypothetical protein [Clostridioides difficile]
METRKTTLDERVVIVKDCIENDFNYNLIAKNILFHTVKLEDGHLNIKIKVYLD